ncbi:MAG: hypothetical protein ACOC8F_08330, partial [Planctomycetota bacterium]
LEKLELTWPGAAAGLRPRAGGDAAEDYSRAAEVARAHAATLRGVFARDNVSLEPEVLRLLKDVHAHVAAGADKAVCRYAARHAEDVHVAPAFAPASDLKRLAEVLLELYKQHRNAERFEEAETVARDMFTFGWHLIRERGHVNVVMVGMQTQNWALASFEYLYGGAEQVSGVPPSEAPLADPLAAAAVKDYDDQLDRLRRQYRDKLGIVYAVKPHAGDVFKLVTDDADHAWRVQALLTCGVLKHTAGRRGDVRYARKLIARHLDSDDALLAAAAAAAAAFTDAQAGEYQVPHLEPYIGWPPGTRDYD